MTLNGNALADEMPAQSGLPVTRSSRLLFSMVGIFCFIALWGFLGTLLFNKPGYDHFKGFLPSPALKALLHLFYDSRFWASVWDSLVRIITGIAMAFLIGFPAGLAMGFYGRLRIATYFPVQFLRMISPLAWMPIALLVFKEFESAICFLITISTIWPILLNTIFGVTHVERQWIEMAIDQGASDRQLISAVIIPAIIPQTVSGLRLSLGVAWIVLVPAEFLGVSSGLGYLINDARDTLEYDRLMGIVIAIGLIGFFLDGAMHLVQDLFSEQGLIKWKRNFNDGVSHTFLFRMIKDTLLFLKKESQRLRFWVILDILYVALFCLFGHQATCRLECGFLTPHLYGVFVGTLVMFTGLGAGVLWFPFLTFLDFSPKEIVPISLFNQIMGKGSGTFKYFTDNLLDKKTAIQSIPFAMAGVFIGFSASFIVPKSHEKWLYIVFVGVVIFLLLTMIFHKNPLIEEERPYRAPAGLLWKSNLVLLCASVFTGLLSIGNSDWLIPYMESRLKMPAQKAIATGIFIMFISALFYMVLALFTVLMGRPFLPENRAILFATCSGVILGGQIGSRLGQIHQFKTHQRRIFIIMMALSAIHITWEFILHH